MKLICSLLLLAFCNISLAQSVPLPHGTVFGKKPDTTVMERSALLSKMMGNKTSISTTLSGTVKKVTKVKGGWFDLLDGNGKVIPAHFKDFNVNLPKAIKGRGIIVEGVAVRQFIADDMQHFAGDTVVPRRTNKSAPRKKPVIIFEVTGLMVDK